MTKENEVTFEMAPIIALLKEVLASVESMDSYSGPIDFDQGRGPRHNDPTQAAMGRRLLHDSEVLRTAASELQMQYWALKGWPDGRFTD